LAFVRAPNVGGRLTLPSRVLRLEFWLVQPVHTRVIA
jgi:hypothetical protein